MRGIIKTRKTSSINVTCHKVINVKMKIIFAFANIKV